MARNEDIFDLLLSRTTLQNINLNLYTNEGHTPLWYALISSRLCNPNSFAARLVEMGAVPNPVSITLLCTLVNRAILKRLNKIT